MNYTLFVNYIFITRLPSYDGVAMVIWIIGSQRETSQILLYNLDGDDFVVSSANNHNICNASGNG